MQLQQVTGLGATARTLGARAIAASDDLVRAVRRDAVEASRIRMFGPGNDALDGALCIRIIADESDQDGMGMVRALRARGADAAIWSVDHLTEAASGLHYRGAPAPMPEFAIPYHVTLDDAGLDTLRMLEARGVPMLNSTDAIVTSRDKGLAARLLPEHLHPRTIEITHHSQAREAIEELWIEGVPIFLKNPIGTQGIGVAGITSKSQAIAAAELITAGGDRRLLIQQGLVLPEGVPVHDTRHFIIDGEHVAAMRRMGAEGELRTGLHSGGRGVAYEATAEEKAAAVEVAERLGLSGVAGVDQFGSKFLEVNYGPGHRIATVTGVDIPGKLADVAIRRASEQRARVARAVHGA